MKKVILSIVLLLVVTIISCHKDSPSPSSTNNNHGGGIDTTKTDTTNCDAYYENCTYHGHSFKLLYYMPCTSITTNDSIWGQLICGKKYYDQLYVYNPIYQTGNLVGYDKYNNVYTTDPDFMPTLSDIQSAITAKGSYKIPEVMDDQSYNHIDSSVHAGFYLKANGGYNPDTKQSFGGWGMNISSTNEFYYEINKVTHWYGNFYVIEGSKKILLVRFNGIDGIPYYDTLQSTFKIPTTF